MKQKPEPRTFAIRAMVAARAILAVTMLLALVAGSIAWPAAASGPLCTLSCCAGRAPHAAGSCMHGSCETGVTHSPAKSSQHAHHNHEQEPAEESDSSSAFSGVRASVGGSEMAAPPTVEATPYEDSAAGDARADTSGLTSNRSAKAGMSATVLSKPCQYDCGACAPGFAAPKRSRDAAALTRSHHSNPSSSAKLAAVRHPLMHISSAQGRQTVPRGPPPIS